MKADLLEEIEVPEGIQASYANGVMKIEGKNSVERTLFQPKIEIKVNGNKISFSSKKATLREKKNMYSMVSHVKNMFRGANEPHVYKLKICSGHFPMNVAVNNGKLVVKNFLGEAVPRELTLKEGADVKLDGEIITVESPNKEIAGQQAGDIEQLTKITNRDRRIFQDGIYITVKDGRTL